MNRAKLYNADQAQLAEAVEEACRAWQQGGLVVFPTETVYGVGAWALSDASLDAQQRLRCGDPNQQYTVHLPTVEAARQYIDTTQRGLWPVVAKLLAAPVTVVVDVPASSIEERVKALGISAEAQSRLYQEGTVSLRCPSDPVARRMLAAVQGPIVAGGVPSADGPVYDGERAAELMNDAAAVIVNTGRTRYAKPSTVVRVGSDGKAARVTLIREGVLDQRSIRKLRKINVLMVCSGNTCRSPMAAGVTRKHLAEAHGVPVSELPDLGLNIISAGTQASPGFLATAEAIAVAEKRGIDLKRHRSQPLTRELINGADYIFCMTQNHLHAVLRGAPDAADRIVLLDEVDVADPIGGGVGQYEQAIAQIEKAVIRRLDELNL